MSIKTRTSPWVPGFSSFGAGGDDSGSDIGGSYHPPMSQFSSHPSSLVPGPMDFQPGHPSGMFLPGWPEGPSPQSAEQQSVQDQVKTKLSGADWVHEFPDSKSLDDLEPKFKSNVQDFFKAIKDAGGTAHIGTTKRPPERAYLMHWSWKIAKSEIKAAEVDGKHKMPGVNIKWDHGNDEESIKAARAMNALYGSKFEPSLTTNHVKGNAIDVRFFGLIGKKVKKKDGTEVEVKIDTSKDPRDLIPVGESYGVYHKILKDTVHWSTTGH